MIMILNKFRNLPLRQKLFLSIFVFIILPLIISAFMINNYFIRQNIRNITETNLQILKQTDQSFLSLINEVDNLSVRILSNEDIQTLLSYDSDADNQNYMGNIVEINRWLSKELLFSTDIDSIAISSKNDSIQVGNVLHVSTYPEIIKKAVSLNGVGAWSYIYQANSMDNGKSNTICYYRAINDLNLMNKNLAVEIIAVDENRFSKLYSKLNIYEGGEIYLIDTDDTVISSSNKKIIGKKYNTGFAENIPKQNEGFFEDHLDSRDNIVLYYTVSKTGWRLVQIIPRSFYQSLTNTINTVIFIAILFCLLFGILFSVIQNSVILKPLQLLLKEMEKLRKGNFDVKFTTKSNDEIGKIINEYMGIIAQLKELVNTVYISKTKQREAELIALEAQINPHFLYNTLDSIHWLALKEKNYKVSEQLEALSEMFRHVLHNGSEIVTIGEEMNFLNNYMLLQQAKYGDRIKLSVYADEELYECLTPKLILQPLIENAVLHGLEPKLEGGTIDVFVKQEADDIRLIVSDNGAGADGEIIQAMIRDKRHSSDVFALKNIDERIRMQYGEKFGLSFSGEVGRGVRVEVLIPLIKKDRSVMK